MVGVVEGSCAVGSDRGGELVECGGESQPIGSGFKAEFVVAAA
jgi:hypothetical protein